MSFKQKILMALGLVLTGLIGRLVPHLWNMTPIAGVAIFAGAKLGYRWGIIVPIISMVLGDIFLGFYSWPIMLSVYACFALSGLAGGFLGKAQKVSKILGGTLILSLVFFLVTNATVWAFGTMYPHNLFGLVSSYIAGLPFFQNQILGDLFFTSALFMVWEVGKFSVRSLKFRSLTEKILTF